jgi:hypothetical protein
MALAIRARLARSGRSPTSSFSSPQMKSRLMVGSVVVVDGGLTAQ